MKKKLEEEAGRSEGAGMKKKLEEEAGRSEGAHPVEYMSLSRRASGKRLIMRGVCM